MAATRLTPIPGVRKLAFDPSSDPFLVAEDSGFEAFGTGVSTGRVAADPPPFGSGTAAALTPEPLAPSLPTDDLFASQFYLRNTAAGERDLGLFRGDTS